MRKARNACIFFILLVLALGVRGQGKPDLAALEKKVEALRGLTFLSPVQVAYVDDAGMRAVVQGEIAREYTAKEWPRMEETLKVFGLIPPKMDLRKQLDVLLDEQVAGLYDPHTGRLYVNRNPVDDGELGSQLGLPNLHLTDVFLVHELDHALTDQHFHLLSLPLEDRRNEDRADAARCVVEGDATWVMLRYLYQLLQVKPDQQRNMSDLMTTMGIGQELMGESVPAYLQKNLLIAYLAGYRLVQAAYERGGFKAIDDLYLHPPQSMEQVLHPSKYFAGSDPTLPVEAELPAAWRKARWSEMSKGVWGEFNTKILLEEWGVSKDRANAASEGWRGDRYVVGAGSGGEKGFVWNTAWDTDKDAQRFAAVVDEIPGLTAARSGERVTLIKGGPLLASQNPGETKVH
jgi:hypothetical protein